MAQPAADRNLLFGILAMQMDFITREQLIAAMQAWVFDKGKPLGEILLSQKALDADNRQLLDALVQKHLAKHGGDAEKSLAAVSSLRNVRKDLEQITDPDVQQSLGHVAVARGREPDPWATVAPPSGMRLPGSPRFRIVRPHARGGLGEVFIAMDEELNREVALKEIQEPQADNPESRLRFLLEAEITGGLEHPGIVPVYGLGTYADGRPYYAMRFIRGDSLKDSIERYHKALKAGMDAGQRALALRSLLGRFVDVCEAIAYAHSRGVLHRDLKPGNIMLGKYGETLVVDWGLAKPLGAPVEGKGSIDPGEGSLQPTSLSAASQTMVGAAVGTPQYMSPEQAGGRLDQLGPASDVYSLGATLYCILTGKSPISESDVGTVLHKVQRGDFPKPRQVDATVPTALEAVCVKAMALHPADRYPSPKDLADDIEHWLADEPVSAWQEPWSVKARRWMGRNATLVAGVASAILVTLVGLIVTTILLTAANERERLAKNKAEENFQLARSAVERFHTEVSTDVLLNEKGMEDLRKKLLQSAKEYNEKFLQARAGDKDLQREVGRSTYRLAQITADIDSNKKAIDLHQQALKIFAAIPAAQGGVDLKNDQALCMHHLGRIYRLDGQIEKSREYYTKAHDAWSQLAKDHPNENRFKEGLARTQMGLGNVHQVARELDKAKDYYEKSTAGWKALADANPKSPEYQRELAVDHNNIGVAYRSMGGKEKEAEALFRTAKTIQTALVEAKPNSIEYQNDLARTCFNLAALLLATAGPASEAPAHYQEAATRRARLVERHPAVPGFHAQLALTYAALANAYRHTDKKKAQENATKALEIQRKVAEKNPGVASIQADLGRVYFAVAQVHQANADPVRAEASFQDALKIRLRLASASLGDAVAQSELAQTHVGLGFLYARTMQPDKAEAEQKKALPLWEKLIEAYPAVQDYAVGKSQTCFDLGELARTAGKAKEAAGWYTRSLASFDAVKLKSLESVDVRKNSLNAHWKRAEVRTDLKQFTDALADWNKAVELAPSVSKTFFQIQVAAALARAGKHVEAAAEAEKVAANLKGGNAWFRFAGIYALASAAAATDPQKTPEERKKLADKHAAQSIALLTFAAKADFFQAPANLKRLQADPDFDSLRGRPEFKKFLSVVESK